MKTQKHSFELLHDSKVVPYSIYTNSDWRVIKQVLLLGTLQGASSARAVVRRMPPGAAVVQGVPHWAAKNGIYEVEFFAKRLPHSLLAARAGRQLLALAQP